MKNHGGATSSVSMTVLTLLKNMMGGGIFSLPVGLWYATPQIGIVILTAIGVLSAITYWMVGYCCISWGVGDFRNLWNRTLGEKTAWIIDVTLFVNGWFTLVTYIVLIGDFTTKSCEGLISPTHILATNRNLNQWTIVAVVLIPLSLQKDLSKLAFTSVLGLCIMAYVIFLVVSDSWLHAPKEWGPDVVVSEWRMGVFEAIAIYAHAFVAHYNSPKIFSELENPTQSRWATMVFTTYTLAFIIYASFAWTGFRRFEGTVEGNILKNHEAKINVLIAWLGMGFCMAFTYPIIFNAMRLSFVNLFRMFQVAVKWDDPDATIANSTGATISLVIITAIAATFCSDVGVVNALSGSILGCLVAFVYPSLLFYSTAKQQLEAITAGSLGTSLLKGSPTSGVKLQSKSEGMMKVAMAGGVVGAISGLAFAVIGTTVILTRTSGGGH